jgi:hypothetical protein
MARLMHNSVFENLNLASDIYIALSVVVPSRIVDEAHNEGLLAGLSRSKGSLRY